MNRTEDGCLTAAVMFGVPGIRVLDAHDDGRVLRLTVETVDVLTACGSCGVVARKPTAVASTPCTTRRSGTARSWSAGASGSGAARSRPARPATPQPRSPTTLSPGPPPRGRFP